MKNKEYILIVILFAALPLFFFAQTVFGGKTFIGTDIQSFFYPFKFVAAEMYRTGSFHLWDPYIFGGLPISAEIQTGLFYPLNLLFAVLPIFKAISFYIVIHLFLSSLFMYLYLRCIGSSRPAAAFGAVAFTYNGFYMMHVDQLSMLSVSTWLPLILLCVEKAFEEKKFSFVILAALVTGVQFLGGHPQASVILGFAAAFYVVFKLVGPIMRKEYAEARRRMLISVFIAVIGFGIASIALIPFFETYPFSLRSGDNYDTSSAINVSPAELQTFLVPELREKGSESRMFGGTGETYAGVIPVILAIYSGIFLRGPLAIFYLALGLFSILASFGKAFPLHFILYHFVPFYGKLEMPIRVLLLYVFSVSALSAFAIDDILRRANEPRTFLKWALITILSLAGVFLLFIMTSGGRLFLMDFTEGGIRAPLVFLLLCAAFLMLLYFLKTGKLNAKFFVAGLVCLTLLDLLPFATRYFRLADEGAAGERPPLFGFFDQDKDLYRVSIGVEDIGPDLPMVYKVQSISGYSPVIFRDFIYFVLYNASHSLDFSGIPTGSRVYVPPYVDSRMIGLLNVKYHVLSYVRDDRYFIGVQEIKNYLPRAFIVAQPLVTSDRNEILVKLGEKDFDPKQVVILETSEGLSGYKFTSKTVGSAAVTLYSPDRIDIVASSDADAMLFTSEIFFPGWVASVDGKPQRIYRADYLFRAVPLKAGKHSITFTYAPFSYRIGRYLTLGSLLICFFCLFWPKARPDKGMNDSGAKT
jgi:hypothetical protein